jgi:hypothetical protein
MKAFDVFLNGDRLCLAGIDGDWTKPLRGILRPPIC